jgi:hypothetical protein
VANQPDALRCETALYIMGLELEMLRKKLSYSMDKEKLDE